MAESDEKLLRCLSPLKVVLVTENAGAEEASIATAIRRAFHGATVSGEASEAYFAAGEDLGVSVLDADIGMDANAANKLVRDARDSALHTLVVSILTEPPGRQFQDLLEKLDEDAGADGGDGSVVLMPVELRERLWQGQSQSLNYVTLGEYALRPVYAAAHALACAWLLAGPQSDRLRLFISHAKLDGLPLAQSFKHQLEQIAGLRSFYDAVDITPGTNWRRILREGVETSTLVALRTNVYEERAWCVQEMD